MTTLEDQREPASEFTHARRLDALWKMSTNTALNDEGMTRALLAIATRTLRRGQAFSAFLHRVNGPVLVLEEALFGDDDRSVAPEHAAIVELEQTPLLEVVRRQATHASTDLSALPDMASRIQVCAGGMRAFIGTVFRAGGATYTVALFSTRPFAGQFDWDDTHFMESLATLLEKRLEGRIARARVQALRATA